MCRVCARGWSRVPAAADGRRRTVVLSCTRQDTEVGGDRTPDDTAPAMARGDGSWWLLSYRTHTWAEQWSRRHCLGVGDQAYGGSTRPGVAGSHVPQRCLQRLTPSSSDITGKPLCRQCHTPSYSPCLTGRKCAKHTGQSALTNGGDGTRHGSCHTGKNSPAPHKPTRALHDERWFLLLFHTRVKGLTVNRMCSLFHARETTRRLCATPSSGLRGPDQRHHTSLLTTVHREPSAIAAQLREQTSLVYFSNQP